MARMVSNIETRVGYGILLILVIIATVMLLEQSRYNSAIIKPAAFQADSPTLTSSPTSSSLNMSQYAPNGLSPLSPAESFGPENLSDKINGKAELYLSAGFVALSTQRFTLREEPGVWLEAFVYDMGSIKNSFAVYSLQRRFEAKNLDLSEFAYGTENALYFAHGPYYVELISSVARQEMTELMRSYGENFVRRTAVSHDVIHELALFPSKYLVQGSTSLLPSDGFGFERFDSIFTAQYIISDTELTAFLSRRQSQAEAAELVETYTSFLVANGGTQVESSLKIPGAKLVQIMDTFELFFRHANMLAGVHSAENKITAEELASMLKQNLAEADR